jgi:hypothetical protein
MAVRSWWPEAGYRESEASWSTLLRTLPCDVTMEEAERLKKSVFRNWCEARGYLAAAHVLEQEWIAW